MARPRKVQDAELIYMIKDRRLPLTEVAEKTGLTVSGVNQSVRRLRKTGQLPPAERLDHSEAVPWPLAKEHSRSRVARYLRELSSVAQDKKIWVDNQNTALRWAQQLVDNGFDVDYDREEPPNEFSTQGGFFLKEADPDRWHLLDVLNRAKAGVRRQKN